MDCYSENEVRRQIMDELEAEIVDNYDGPEDRYNTRLLNILQPVYLPRSSEMIALRVCKASIETGNADAARIWAIELMRAVKRRIWAEITPFLLQGESELKDFIS